MADPLLAPRQEDPLGGVLRGVERGFSLADAIAKRKRELRQEQQTELATITTLGTKLGRSRAEKLLAASGIEIPPSVLEALPEQGEEERKIGLETITPSLAESFGVTIPSPVQRETFRALTEAKLRVARGEEARARKQRVLSLVGFGSRNDLAQELRSLDREQDTHLTALRDPFGTEESKSKARAELPDLEVEIAAVRKKLKTLGGMPETRPPASTLLPGLPTAPGAPADPLGLGAP